MSLTQQVAERLRLIDEAVQQALDLADQGDEALLGALLYEVRDALVKRYAELGRQSAD